MKTKYWLIVSGGFAVIALAFTIGFVAWRWADIPFASHDLDRQWERAKKNGYPLTAQALKPAVPVRASDNAAPMLLKAASLLTPSLQSRLNQFRTKSGELTPSQRRQALELAKPVFDLVERATAKSRYRVDRDYDYGPELLYPEYSAYKAIARGLAARAVDNAKAGDLQGAIRDIAIGRKLAAFLCTEPILIGQLVGLAVEGTVNRGVERVAEVVAKDPTALRALRQQAVEDRPLNPDIRIGVRGEIYQTLTIARNRRRYGTLLQVPGETIYTKSNPSQPPVRSGQPEDQLSKAYLARSMAAWNDLLESPEWKTADPVAIGEKWKVLATQYDTAASGRMSYSLSDLLFPSLGGAGKSMVRPAAERTVLCSLIKALEYRAVHGSFPKALSDVGAEAPDRFKPGSQIRYRTDGGTAKVWSVGPDGEDDGAIGKNSLDVVASYPAR